uniref:Uncharacterized protein n=1 Tax=Physcomitrium patens TaxID=3218 RepID=A0A7I4A6L1_PHYPA
MEGKNSLKKMKKERCLVHLSQQVPASLVGFTRPWHPGARSESKLQPQRGQEFAGFWTDQSFVGSNKPVELPRPMDEAKSVGKSSVADSGACKPSVDISKPIETAPASSADCHNLPQVGKCRHNVNIVPFNLFPAGFKQDSNSPMRSYMLPNISQECQVSQGQDANSAKVHSVESLQRQQSSRGDKDNHNPMIQDAAILRVDETSILSSRRSSAHHSSRSLCQGPLLEEAIKNNPPHLLPQPPGSDRVVHVTKTELSNLIEEIFPRNTNSLAQLKIGNPTPKMNEILSRVSRDPVLGGSSRVTRPCESQEGRVARAPTSLPTSPRSITKESRASKLFKKFKLSGPSSRGNCEIGSTYMKSGGRNSLRGAGNLSKENGSNVARDLVNSPERTFAKSLEPHKVDITNGMRSDHSFEKPSDECGSDGNRIKHAHVPIIQSECLKVDSNSFAGSDNGSQPIVRAPEGNAALQENATQKKSSSRWLFKWKWGLKPSAKVVKASVKRMETPSSRIVNTDSAISPSAEIMSDAHNSFYTKSDRFSSSGIGRKRSPSSRFSHRRGSSWGCASHTCTATVNTGIRIIQRSRLPDENGAIDGSQAFAGSGVDSVDCDRTQSFRDCQDSFPLFESPRKSLGSFRSAGVQSFRKSDVFEDCLGSFRSIGSPVSFTGSFRSVDSPNMNRSGGRKRFPSVEEIEWDSRLPPPLQGDQTLRIVDVAALCNSSLKFVFKCREIQHFNRFLRRQKRRLLDWLKKGNTDRFNVVRSGADIEVSSMVSAMCYAWFLENTVPKVTGATWHAVPVIDIPRHQMHKHKDAAWLFDACGIDAAALLFADEIEMASLIEAERVKISVVEQDVLVTRNEVGSVCTLLSEKLLVEAQCLLEPRYMKTLLLAGILLDTENLDFASMRDTEMTTMLLVGSSSLGRNGFYDQLRRVEDDNQVSEFITRFYGDGKQLSGDKICPAAESKVREEADQEQFDKDSLFTQSQDQTSTSEAGTSCSSLDDYSPRLKQSSSFKYTKLISHSAPARTQLPSPSSAGCNEDNKAVAHIRKAATRSVSSEPPASGARSPISPNFRIRRKLFLYQA